ncbi:AgrD family cyclic lactone autoinducer peptide [Tannockella kyphosi]|nr:cyclic lactone autoinducer peptide [Tannockella kyphosi]
MKKQFKSLLCLGICAIALSASNIGTFFWLYEPEMPAKLNNK